MIAYVRSCYLLPRTPVTIKAKGQNAVPVCKSMKYMYLNIQMMGNSGQGSKTQSESLLKVTRMIMLSCKTLSKNKLRARMARNPRKDRLSLECRKL